MNPVQVLMLSLRSNWDPAARQVAGRWLTRWDADGNILPRDFALEVE